MRTDVLNLIKEKVKNRLEVTGREVSFQNRTQIAQSLKTASNKYMQT